MEERRKGAERRMGEEEGWARWREEQRSKGDGEVRRRGRGG